MSGTRIAKDMFNKSRGPGAWLGDLLFRDRGSPASMNALVILGLIGFTGLVAADALMDFYYTRAYSREVATYRQAVDDTACVVYTGVIAQSAVSDKRSIFFDRRYRSGLPVLTAWEQGARLVHAPAFGNVSYRSPPLPNEPSKRTMDLVADFKEEGCDPDLLQERTAAMR